MTWFSLQMPPCSLCLLQEAEEVREGKEGKEKKSGKKWQPLFHSYEERGGEEEGKNGLPPFLLRPRLHTKHKQAGTAYESGEKWVRARNLIMFLKI